jgi:hypothetical protein
VRDTYRIGENYNYVKPYELYVLPFENQTYKFQAGRVLKDWSQADAYWEQGLWQPRFLDDKFLMEEAGLAGFFGEFRSGSSTAMLWASPLFIPEIGPDFSIRDGQFISGSPWFKPPTSQVLIGDQPTRTRYRVNYPDIKEIVLNPGVGGQWQTKDAATKRYLRRISYAYKPMNQLLLGFPYYLELSENADSSALNIEVNPRVLYHHLATWETEQDFGRGRLLTALTFDSPRRDSTPSTWITQEVKDALIASLEWEQGLGPGRLNFGWLRVWGGDQPDAGDFAPEGTLFERRFQYLQALRAGWDGEFVNIGNWAWAFSSRFTYDVEQAGLVWGSQLTARPTGNLYIHLRADLIGLTGEEEKIDSGGFINTYRANDRVQTGVSYAF